MQCLGNSRLFLVGALLQMGFAVALKFLFHELHLENAVTQLVLLVLGGTSTALWGCVVAIKSHKARNGWAIISDFFHLKAGVRYYLFIAGILLLLFGASIVSGHFAPNVVWYSFFIFFAQALLFGGIEEIGWRYTFQPGLETVLPFAVSCLVTFICWGTWHYMYFYITDVVANVSHLGFLMGLLVNCFVLGALYRCTQNLWLCVFFHSCVNALSQIYQAASLAYTLPVALLCIGLSLWVVYAHTIRSRDRSL